jgi:hypothetical protein
MAAVSKAGVTSTGTDGGAEGGVGTTGPGAAVVIGSDSADVADSPLYCTKDSNLYVVLADNIGTVARNCVPAYNVAGYCANLRGSSKSV